MAAFVALAVGCFAAADAPVRFSGLLEGRETDTLQGNPPSGISVNGSVTGIDSTIGRFTLKYQVTVSLPVGSATGTAELKTPNGDTILTTIAGLGVQVPGSATLNSIVEVNRITGGTGRFARATGKFIVQRFVDLGTGWTSGSIWLAVSGR